MRRKQKFRLPEKGAGSSVLGPFEYVNKLLSRITLDGVSLASRAGTENVSSGDIFQINLSIMLLTVLSRLKGEALPG